MGPGPGARSTIYWASPLGQGCCKDFPESHSLGSYRARDGNGVRLGRRGETLATMIWLLRIFVLPPALPVVAILAGAMHAWL